MRKQIAYPGPIVVPRAASQALDFMRAAAALMVLLSHVRPLFFVDYAEVQNKTPLIKLLYLLTGVGHEAVVIFFVLSGLLIGMSVLRTHTRNAWSWSDYLLHRLTRLWVVLVPALLLTVFWDWLGIRFFGAQTIYAGLPSDRFILGFNAAERLNLPTFLGNLFFLQGTVGTTLGTNGPLWSLAYEFWYYIAFACLVRFWVAPKVVSRLFHGVLLVLMGALLNRDLVLQFSLWLMGVVILFLPGLWRNYRSSLSLWIGVWSGLLLAALALSAVKNSFLMNVALGICCSAILYFVFRLPQSDPALQADIKASEGHRIPLVKRFADFSFSLYVLHLPPLVFLHALLWHRGIEKWQPSVQAIAIGLLICFAAIAYAYIVSRFTEAHTDKVRRWVKQTLMSKTPAPQATGSK